GKHGLFFRGRNEAVIDVFPNLIVDPNSAEPTLVDSDTMRFYPDQELAIASGRVKILKGITVTQCDSAVVVDREKRVELYGNPLAQQDNLSMRAKRMFLYYDDEEVNKIGLLGDAVIRETAKDTLIVDRDSWVQGDSMDLYLRNNRVDSMSVIGQAVSEYYPRSVDRVEASFARGNRMFFVFDKDSLSSVRITGEADGVYRHINLGPRETADSLRSLVDTTLTYVPFEQRAEKIVYSADSVVYYARERDMVLVGTAKVDYSDRTLLAKYIKYNSNLQLMDATGSPVLIEGVDKLHGTQMGYDLDSGVGLVKEGTTKFMEGYYQGEDIAKVGENVLKVWNSTYTTCDQAVPHYHFSSNQMKVYLDDKVVTGPIVLYIGQTPIAALPFFAQNIRRGRRSGILRPDFEFGFTSRSGRFIRNVGYYWATNDYTDFTFTGDFNEDSRLQLRVDNQYRLRYHFNGGFNYRFLRRLSRNVGEPNKEWTIASRHSQTFANGYKLNANLSFVSSDAAPREVNNIDEVRDVINRNIRSTASLSKTWEGIIGFSGSATRQQNLDVREPGGVRVNTTLPDIRLSIPSRTLYFGSRSARGDKSFWQELLDGIRYSPGVDFRRTVVERRVNSPFAVTPPADSIPLPMVDPIEIIETISSNQSLSFSSPAKVGFINISPSLSARNNYTRTVTKADEYLDADTTLVQASRIVASDDQFSWNVGGNASTNFYGTFYPKMGVVTGLRHKISPSVSYTFQPAQNNRPRSQRFSVGLSNSLDLKVKGDESDQERKLSNVVLWSLRSSYNPDAPSGQGWSTVGSNFNTQLYGLSISVNNSIDPYAWEVTTTQVTSGLTLRGTHGLGSAEEATAVRRNPLASDTTETVLDETSDVPDERRDREAKGLPWSLRAQLSYSKSRNFDPLSTLNLGGSINLTQSWRVTYNTSYNVEERRTFGQNYAIHRDLHCWEMSLSRQQLADEWEFYFKITLKAHPEIYAEQGPRGLAGGGGLPGQFGY
ncbi:MAG: putative LPS assembly protein LptD, partial [Candidatus Krumholzibacteria bacterium]|nr:putative LPS assembly protein LptD [Candidatus Krumholzibacteria bacterium]